VHDALQVEAKSQTMIDALRSLRSNEQQISELIGKYTMEVLARGFGARMVVREEVMVAIEKEIEKHSASDEPQLRYIHALETMIKVPGRKCTERRMAHRTL
jgi:hypothetical protein